MKDIKAIIKTKIYIKINYGNNESHTIDIEPEKNQDLKNLLEETVDLFKEAGGFWILSEKKDFIIAKPTYHTGEVGEDGPLYIQEGTKRKFVPYHSINFVELV